MKLQNLISRFGDDFVWGTATSAYQIEGAAHIGGRGPSIWDTFSETPGNVLNDATGEVACDHYHHYEEDIKLMSAMGVDAYRFSISWSRIMSDGTTDTINPEGINFYNKLIDCCLAHNVTPWVTLYHWDLPDSIEKSMGGWLSDDIPALFAEYANLCFASFGDRVTHWISLNEPWVVAVLGYGQGVFAPGHVSNSKPYLAAHNLLLAHAEAVQLYREKYQPEQQGQIGITNNCDWREPLTDSCGDKAAALTALEFFLGWFADPIYLGDYPASMRANVGNRLPEFTPEQKKMLLGSSDFFGLNHYTTMYAAEQKGESKEVCVYGNGGLNEDQNVQLSVDEQWQKTDMQWAVVPWGCRKLLQWVTDRYDGPQIYITENGCAYDDQLKDGLVDDQARIEFYAAYIEECANAIDLGVNLKGYFAWSLLDNFEWSSGYTKRFGLHYVDFESGKRIPKQSAIWFSRLLNSAAKHTDKSNAA